MSPHGDAIASVVAASAQSVAKVYVIGAVGYAAVKLPRVTPFLPAKSVSAVARFGFNMLLIPLIYTTTATSVTPSSIGDYWFVIVAAFFVFAISYTTATVVGCALPIQDAQDFCALRIAATFPNIVALPILIFPSLCEYPVVHNGFVAANGATEGDRISSCIATSNTMIFCYFFSWSLAFWSLGYRQLMSAAELKSNLPINPKKRKRLCGEDSEVTGMATESSSQLRIVDESTTTPRDAIRDGADGGNDEAVEEDENRQPLCTSLWKAAKQTFTSAGFLAMAAGVITGCIPPLQKALFEPAGVLRFLGSALETLGKASSPIATMVVAASLVPPPNTEEEETLPEQSAPRHEDECGGATEEETRHLNDTASESMRARKHRECQQNDDNYAPDSFDLETHDDDADSARRMPQPRPSSRPGRFSLRRLGLSIRRSSSRILRHAPRPEPEQRRLLLWFVLSRLILAPAIVTGLVAGLDCAGWLQAVPGLAKLVIVINASLPGALTVVVLLKSDPNLADSAAAVARVYLPSYLISIVTIAAWTALGLWISLPGADGNGFCY